MFDYILIHHLSNAMHRIFDQLSDNVAIDGFCLIISANLKSPMLVLNAYENA